MQSGQLEKFVEDLSGSDPSKPPFKISAGKLDRNYQRCYPRDYDGENRPYVTQREESGWILKFPWWPPPSEGTWVLGAKNGTMQWLATEECEEG